MKRPNPPLILPDAYIPSNVEILVQTILPPRSTNIPSKSRNTFRNLSRFSSTFQAVGPNAASTPRNCREINNGNTSF